MPIGRFSRSCRLGIKALRHYDELGLLRPAHVDPSTGYRYYESSQARVAVTIALLRELEVPLPAIRRLLAAGPVQIAELLAEQRDRIARELAARQLALQTIERLVQAQSLMPYEVATRAEPPRTMACMSITTDATRHVVDSITLAERLFAALRAMDLPIVDPVIGRMAWASDADDMTVEMLAPVPEACASITGAAIERMPGRAVAWTVHRGPYEALGLAHHAVFAWAQEHGHEPSGDVLEIYVNDPANVRPDELVTEVLMPIA